MNGVAEFEISCVSAAFDRPKSYDAAAALR